MIVKEWVQFPRQPSGELIRTDPIMLCSRKRNTTDLEFNKQNKTRIKRTDAALKSGALRSIPQHTDENHEERPLHCAHHRIAPTDK